MTRIFAQDPLPARGWTRPRRTALDHVAALIVAASLATGVGMTVWANGTAAADPPASQGTASARGAPPVISIFRQSTYRAMARVPQFTLTQCVGASVQTMLNQVTGRIDRTAVRQRSLFLLARRLSLYRGDGGADPFGWAGALRQAGGGHYVAIGEPTLAAALWVGAKLMRLTHRPVGALVWNGGHAWSISGFETTADPAATDDFTVTAVYPIDPLFPRYKSRRWPVVTPLARMEVGRLATYLTRYRDPRRDPRIQNLFVVIVPVGADWRIPTPPATLLAPPPVPWSISPAQSAQPSPPGAAASPSASPSASADPGTDATPTPPGAVPTPEPTATPQPTATPEPAATPEATPTPSPADPSPSGG